MSPYLAFSLVSAVWTFGSMSDKLSVKKRQTTSPEVHSLIQVRRIPSRRSNRIGALKIATISFRCFFVRLWSRLLITREVLFSLWRVLFSIPLIFRWSDFFLSSSIGLFFVTNNFSFDVDKIAECRYEDLLLRLDAFMSPFTFLVRSSYSEASTGVLLHDLIK